MTESGPTPTASDQGAAPAIEPGLDLVNFQRFIDARREQDEKKYAKVATADGYHELLQEALDLYQSEQSFTTGDLVQWKPMMRNRPMPLESVPAVVVERIDPPLTIDTDGDQLIEPRDLLIAVIDGDNDFVLVQVPSRRFTTWTA